MKVKTAFLPAFLLLAAISVPAPAQDSLGQLGALAPAAPVAAPRAPLAAAGRQSLPSSAARRRLALFAYSPADVLAVKRGRPEEHKGYTSETIGVLLSDPLKQRGEYRQEYIYYRAARQGRRPLVVVFPPFSGTKTIDAWTAAALARRGYNAVIVTPTESLTDASRPIDRTDDLLIRESIAARIALDLLLALPENDPERVYATGISMGGIRTALFFGVEPRVKKAAEIVGGGDLAGVIADTRFRMLAKVRDARMRAEGLATLSEFRSYMQSVMTVDPVDFGRLREPEDLLMMIGEGDVFVPDAYQRRLYEAFSRPEEGRRPVAVYSGAGHLLTAADIAGQVRVSAEFFEGRPVGARRAYEVK